MKVKYSLSTNIIRDEKSELNYIVTANTERSAFQILNDFGAGFCSFSIVGSYGTGKSSFLWAFKNSLINTKQIFDLKLPKGVTSVDFIEFIGEYQSLVSVFRDHFEIDNDFDSNQKLFDAIYQKSENLGEKGLLVLVLDEFGKFLEYAAKNNPEKEMYFIQQLAEFVNTPNRNIVLLTTLHQGFDSYADGLTTSQKNEWQKVKGRFKEIVFNEPVEQLLELAARRLDTLYQGSVTNHNYLDIQKLNKILAVDNTFLNRIGSRLYPFDIFSGYVITKSLQNYGQNERSLFSFFSSTEGYLIEEFIEKKKTFDLATAYDYLFIEFYNFLTQKSNPDYNNWYEIRNALERIEILQFDNFQCAEALIKTIGLLRIFSSKGAKVDDSFIASYFKDKYPKSELYNALSVLKTNKILLWTTYNNSYKVFEGSDLDINDALLKADNQIDEIIDIVPMLESHFDFPVVTAKAHSYGTGTPRLFEYLLTNRPISKTPIGEVDGFINLVFNSDIQGIDIYSFSKNHDEPVLHAFFTNTERVIDSIREIEKTKAVLKTVESDKVARSELQSILRSNEKLLNHYVLDTMFNGTVKWFFKGKELEIRSSKELNKQLSKICDEVYWKSPMIKNELFNRHNVSGTISSARKRYFSALVNSFEQKDLGFTESKFPPEKTIYYTLLQKSGIHKKSGNHYSLGEANIESELNVLWEVSERFLNDTKKEQKPISELAEILSSAPFKLKQGVIDFWIPTFLFVRRGDYALYSDGTFKPYINEQELYLITRTPHLYKLRAFELSNLRLTFFNKYRELLKQQHAETLEINSFIESIRPILIAYKELTPYSQKTKMISKEARNLRIAIENAKEPDNVFFDEFPKALGFNNAELLKSDLNFDRYIHSFQKALMEIQYSYNELLNRIEQFIQSEIIGSDASFEDYKAQLSLRYQSLKEYQLYDRLKVFLQRLNSPLNDRDSWLASIAQALIGKPLSNIEDRDELILKESIIHIINELDNLCEIEKVKVDEGKEQVLKFDITTPKDGLKPYLIRISNEKIQNSNIEIIRGDLGKNKELRIAILAKLLKEELDSE